ncbi:amino acid ABC transporter permease (plasmid) [Salipiger sp. H15]|uniref:Amino acid ABC transporter permease n=1 Tax=Alloyangia sp. H15 TaxID=3029062 RepID=A0AAU8AQX6_9RHOB
MMTAAQSHLAPEPAQEVVHRRNWGAWLLGFLCLGLVLAILRAGIEARILDPGLFVQYLFSRQILIGARNALVLGSLAMVLACGVGLVVALMRVSGNPIMASLAAIYVYFFRGTPMLIQLLFWFNAVPIMFGEIRIPLPFTDVLLLQAQTTQLVTPFVAALIGLSLAEAGYMSEIIRTGIQAVDQGQQAAARALGMTRAQVMRRVVIPQAARIILPAGGNQYIMMLKSTSLASAIGYLELLRIATDIYSSNFLVVELLTVAAVWYLVMTAFATGIQTVLEKTFPLR